MSVIILFSLTHPCLIFFSIISQSSAKSAIGMVRVDISFLHGLESDYIDLYKVILESGQDEKMRKLKKKSLVD